MSKTCGQSSFGSRVKALREGKDETQVHLSQSVNVDASTVSRWENDTRQPDYETLKSLAAHFGCTVEYLVCGARNESDDFVDLSGLSFEVKNSIKVLIRALRNR